MHSVPVAAVIRQNIAAYTTDLLSGGQKSEVGLAGPS